MKLRWRPFEKRTRELVHSEIRASPELKRQLRRTPKNRKLQRIVTGAFAFYFMVAIVVGYGKWATGAIGDASVVAVSVSLPVILLLAVIWLGHLHQVADPIWKTLPLSREQLFAQRTRSFTKTLFFLLTLIALAYLAMEMAGAIVGPWRATALALAQFVIVTATALHISAYFAALRTKISQAAILLIVLLGLAPNFESATAILREHSQLIMAIIPTGWTHHALNGATWKNWLYAAPILLLLAAVPQSFVRVREYFYARPFWTEDAPLQVDDESADEDESREAMNAHARDASADLIADSARNLTNLGRAREGLIEKIVERLWNERERTAGELFWPLRRGWSRSWIGSVKGMAVFLALGALAQYGLGWPTAAMCAIGGGAITSFTTAPLFFLSAPGVRAAVSSGGIRSPMYAAYPIAYDTMYRMLLKVNLARWVSWTILVIIYGSMIAWAIEGNAGFGALVALKAAIALLATQPLMITIALANNTKQIHFYWAIIYVALGLVFAAFLVAFAIEAVVREEQRLPMQMGAWFGAWLFAKVIQLLHRAHYRGRSVDLLQAPQRSFELS